MEKKESLLELFQDLGCTVESPAILEKCFELCESYNVDVEKLTELWLTFCVNNDNNIDPTIDALIELENTVLKKDYKSDNLTKENCVEPQQDAKDEHFIENEALTLHMIIIVKAMMYLACMAVLRSNHRSTRKYKKMWK
ncbi:hypothetical protein EAI_14123 [Harpegnathos saltator]|uniref:DNA polymerase alpha subunit B N-terminal domain-containing protein n=1 Tax=Harpegnathos saltator TaxID=610380 RepID=E2BSJ3_HARSA|nr:hypothetical protein EAI_14123 [Harpegnathos saltator]